MATTTRLLTYDDLLAQPEDGRRYEILDGRLIELASPEVVHQRVLGWLYRWLYAFVADRNLGEVLLAPLDVRLSTHNIVQPDLIYLSRERFGRVEKRPIDGAPDLLVEILSPSTRDRDRGEKMAIYARHGVLEYWLVDVDEHSVNVYGLVGDHFAPLPQDAGTARSAVLPGLTINLAPLFAGVR